MNTVYFWHNLKWFVFGFLSCVVLVSIVYINLYTSHNMLDGSNSTVKLFDDKPIKASQESIIKNPTPYINKTITLSGKVISTASYCDLLEGGSYRVIIDSEGYKIFIKSNGKRLFENDRYYTFTGTLKEGLKEVAGSIDCLILVEK